MAKELEFTNINYLVCLYCKHLVRMNGKYVGWHTNGCSLIQNEEGRYARLAFAERIEELKKDGIDAVDGEKGCDKFENSGVPAYPSVLEELIKANPKCKTIPFDPNAIETSGGFSVKIDKYLPKDQIFDCFDLKIQ